MTYRKCLVCNGDYKDTIGVCINGHGFYDETKIIDKLLNCVVAKPQAKIILEQPIFDKIIKSMAAEILIKYRRKGIQPVLIGIHTRGAILAQRLNNEINRISESHFPIGYLDIGFYRDDLSKKAEKPIVKGTKIPFNIENESVILIDDVLYTGRTIRAAMDALTDLGRPKDVKLAVLIDRGHRELPIEANFVGKSITTKDNEIVHVHFEETDYVDNVEIAEKN
jgi:pyrimidine operon attenuation protein/uracil phosphoribosyltransferase